MKNLVIYGIMPVTDQIKAFSFLYLPTEELFFSIFSLLGNNPEYLQYS